MSSNKHSDLLEIVGSEVLIYNLVSIVKSKNNTKRRKTC